MCRLLYIQNPDKLLKKVSTRKLIGYLQYLEHSSGGHGNGIGGLATYRGTEAFIIAKGLGLSHEKAVKIMKKYNWINGVIWHTRLASSATISSKHNHPHADIDRLLILAHNGHITDASSLLKLLKLFDDRFANYDYSTTYYSRYYDIEIVGSNSKSKKKKKTEELTDTEILTNFIAFMLKVRIFTKRSIDDVMVAVWKHILNNDAVILQLYNGTVYLLVDRDDFEIVNHPELGVIASSEDINRLVNVDTFLSGRGVVKIDNNGMKVIAGSFIEYQYEKPKDYDVIYKKEKPDSFFRVCMSECIEHLSKEECEKICKTAEEEYIIPDEAWDYVYSEIHRHLYSYLY